MAKRKLKLAEYVALATGIVALALFFIPSSADVLKRWGLNVVIAWLILTLGAALVEVLSGRSWKRMALVTFAVALVSGAILVFLNRAETERMSEDNNAKTSDELAIIQRLASELQGEKLLRRYPLGYAIFYVDRQERVIPVEAAALSAYELDWSAVKLKQYQEEGVIDLTLPTLRQKNDGPEPFTISLGLYEPRRVGLINCNTLVPRGKLEKALSVCGEIVAIDGPNVVFLIGVQHLRLPA